MRCVAALIQLLACSAVRVPEDISTDSTTRVDPRTQYDLLRDITAAEGADPQSSDRESVQRRWQGRRVRWEVYRLPTLCGAASPCIVLPFDHARVDSVIRQGWLPRLDLDEAARAKLRERCGPDAECVFTFEGTLRTFTFAPDALTRLAFDEVQVLDARAARVGESWGRRAAPGQRAVEALREKGRALRARGAVPTLHVAPAPPAGATP